MTRSSRLSATHRIDATTVVAFGVLDLVGLVVVQTNRWVGQAA